jgi:arabinogalactan oligomer/maltooligosaccharide transport system substrate-binding protein
LVKGGTKLGINQSAYHNFGFYSAFGGKLLDDSGKCVADQGGTVDALQYLKDLKAAGAQFYTDGGKFDEAFKTAALDLAIEGPWEIGDFKPALGDKLGVAPIPAGPKGPSTPLTGVDGFYVNANTKNVDGAVALAQYLVSPASEQVFVEQAGHIPADKTVTVSDPVTKGFADASVNGFPRPQSKEFSGYWTPFGDAVTKVMEGQSEPKDAVAKACADMNKANNK